MESSTLLAEVPFKSNGRSARFFDNHVEFNGKSIRYDDVAILTTNGLTTIHTYIGIPLGRDFSGGVAFKMISGKTHRMSMSAMSIFGIPFGGNPRKNEELYFPLLDAVNAIIAKNMAKRYIDSVRTGTAVEIAGLTISNYEAVTKKGAVINKENYHECRITDGSGAAVYDKRGDVLWNSSVWNNKNILLIPHILEALFGQ